MINKILLNIFYFAFLLPFSAFFASCGFCWILLVIQNHKSCGFIVIESFFSLSFFSLVGLPWTFWLCRNLFSSLYDKGANLHVLSWDFWAWKNLTRTLPKFYWKKRKRWRGAHRYLTAYRSFIFALWVVITVPLI